ncbi:MFS transporter [Amycolatopsis sp. NPDC088138]|uniref:MFS transporter n=1 Tax=Amycolatopsis sp. NPDC088138 TaxID=3363938 RepID=UPI0037FC5DA8
MSTSANGNGASHGSLAATRKTKPWVATSVLSMGLFVISLDVTVLNVAVFPLSADLRPGPGLLEWILDGYTLTLACGVLAAGAIGDRYGRRRLFACGLMLFTVASVAGAVANSGLVVLSARLLMGAGAALVMPSTLATIGALFPRPRERRWAVAWWALMAGLGGLSGPLLGGYLVQHYGWRAGFWINVPVLVLTLAACRWVPETRDRDAPRVDVRGAALSGMAVFSLVFVIFWSGQHGWGWPAWSGLAASAATSAGFVMHSRRTPEALLPAGLWRVSRFRVSVLVLAASAFCFFGALLLVMFHAQARLGDSPASAGARLLPLVGGMLVGFAVAAVTPPAAERAVTAGGMVLFAAAYLPLVSTMDADGSRLAWFAAIAGTGAGMAVLPATMTVLTCVPPNRAGVGSAVNDATREVGAALGIAVTASLLTGPYLSGDVTRQHTALQQAAVAGAAVALLTVAAAIGTRRTAGHPA